MEKWIKKRFFFSIISILLTISTVSSLLRHVSAAHGNPDDAAFMSKLAKSLVPTPAGWTGSNPYCKWDGVSCDSSHRVIAINLSDRSLSGDLPSFSNLANLQSIMLDNNNFKSVPSDFVAGLRNLQKLTISDNPGLSPWSIPVTLTDSSSLQTFYASNCSITGTIPDIFGSFPNLQTLRLSYNNLTGHLPPSFANSGIQSLILNNQAVGLSGSINILSSMSQLGQVWLQSNQFSGPIPDLSGCTSLVDLQLRDNQLTGPIPTSLSSLPKLTILALQNNAFQGPFPKFPRSYQVSLGNTNSFCNPTPGPCDPQVTTLLEVAGALGYPLNLAASWKGNNPCNGWSFVTCDAKGTVTVINFSKQLWSGTISPAIANLTGLETLLLNDNKLSGSIPSSLTSLGHLELMDVSNNNLFGKIPEFNPRVNLKTSGNALLGKDVPTDPGSGGSTSDGSRATGGKPSVTKWVIVAVVVVALILIAAIALVAYMRSARKGKGKYVKKKTQKNNEKDPAARQNGYAGVPSDFSSENSGESSDIQLYDGGGNVAIPIEILREVTNNFSEDNILGKGGFGVVYKGTLHDGTQIAVKRMESSVATTKGLNEFKAEIEVLTNVRHRHLVALHGFCINGYERLLVYEYMPKGTLAQHLFYYKEMGDSPLNWKQRMVIALDVARGVEYLHTLAQQSFIHRDLKPSNILLGEDMRAKVSDFGLVKSAPEGKASVETRLAGTFGYLAPEYAATGRVTTKVDVFAYGVVLMEIITGRKALDDSLPEEKAHLVAWFRKVIVGGESIRSYLDPTLAPDEETFDIISRVAELAGHCTARDPSNRPDMGHVVNVLSPLVQQWKPPEEESSFGIDFHMSLPEALQKWKDNPTKDLFSTNSFTTTSTPRKTNSEMATPFNQKDAR